MQLASKDIVEIRLRKQTNYNCPRYYNQDLVFGYNSWLGKRVEI